MATILSGSFQKRKYTLSLWFFLESCTSKRACMQQCCCIDSGLLQQVLKVAAYHKIAPKDSLCQYVIKLSCRRYLTVTCRKGEKSVWLLRNATLLTRISNTDLDVCWWRCSFHSCLTSWLSWLHFHCLIFGQHILPQTLFPLKQEADRKIRRVQKKAATDTINSVIRFSWKNVTKCLLSAASLSNDSG